MLRSIKQLYGDSLKTSEVKSAISRISTLMTRNGSFAI